MMKNPKPEPVVVRTVCSLCDQEWEQHGDKPTTLDCIRLLKVAASRRPWYTSPFITYATNSIDHHWHGDVPLTP